MGFGIQRHRVPTLALKRASRAAEVRIEPDQSEGRAAQLLRFAV
jgi:hypothetical protein